MSEEKSYVYILICADGTLYTGWTNNLKKRLRAHNAGTAAKYTRSRLPVRLAHVESFPTRSEALRRERAIKKLSRAAKLRLLHACPAPPEPGNAQSTACGQAETAGPADAL